MQINRVNSVIPKKYNKTAEKNNKNNTSFKGFSVFIANAIENGGLAVSFILQDTLGTNLPRPVMGLRRNAKENNGEINTNFAAKEIVREFTTGPSMFIIPGTLLAIGKRVFGKTINVPMKFIKAFGEVHAANPLNKAGEAISKQEFYQNAFTEIIKNAKSETQASAATIDKAKDFAQRLAQVTKEEAPAGQISLGERLQDLFKNLVNNYKKKKLFNEATKQLTDEFVEISKANATDVVHTDFTTATVSNASSSFKNTVNHMISYADDVVKKAGKKGTAEIPGYINNITNKKIVGRMAAIGLMYAAVLSFLQIIPIMYNKAEGKDNAGLKGLMNEETFHDKSLNNTSDNKKADKSKVSFGSIENVAEALTGNKTIGRLAQGCEFSGPNVSFPLLLGIMGIGILLPRTIRAKDKYDREEILRRDVVTCAVMCYAEKWLRKGFSKAGELKSGFVLATKDKSFKDMSLPQKIFQYLRPIKGIQVLSLNQIESKYTNIGNYNGGIKGFCDFISGQGGNLGKVFSLTEKSKELVNSLLQKEGADIATADNKVITNVLDRAKDSDEVKQLVALFHKARPEKIAKPNIIQKLRHIDEKMVDNPWVTKAKTLNARFTAFSVLVLVPVFLGFLLPAINERATKKRIKEEKALKNTTSTTTNNFSYMDASYFNQSNKASSIFAEMNKF